MIQAAFGWQEYHLHEFTIRGVRYGDPKSDEDGEMDFQDEALMSLKQLGFREGERFSYVYDFGDGWQHTVMVAEVLLGEDPHDPIATGDAVTSALPRNGPLPPRTPS